MYEKKVTCIVCPVGCEITVRGEGGNIGFIEGYTCKRGEEYARNEFLHPVRILTSTAKISGAPEPLLPVRSSKPVPKELMLQCVEEIKKLNLTAPIKSHEVLIHNILGTGTDIIASANSQ